MNEREVVVYFYVAFETHEFTVNRDALVIEICIERSCKNFISQIRYGYY